MNKNFKAFGHATHVLLASYVPILIFQSLRSIFVEFDSRTKIYIFEEV